MSFFQSIKNAACQVIKAVQIKITNIILDLFWKYNYTMILIEDKKNDDEWVEMKDPQSSKPFWMNIQSGGILSFNPATRTVASDNDW